VGYIENCGELGKWSEGFWQMIHRGGASKGFWRVGVFWGFWCGKFLVGLGVFGGWEFLGFLSFLNFKYILWN
jgi:hypothetical protein